jgi:lysophospholipase L1-like esterase
MLKKLQWTAALAATLLPMPQLAAAANTPSIRVILVGDSTMATKSGYGDALCARFKPEVVCLNLARGGRSSASYRAEGLWDQVQQLLRDDGSAYAHNYLLIQFGHNDQPGKPGRSTDLVNDFPANMARYVREAKALGAKPVLVTPLTRRTFRGPVLKSDLAPWAAAVRQVAAEQRAPLLDLYALSADAVQQMGEDEADTLAMAPRPAPGAPEPVSAGANNPVFDRTHLGPKGAALFAQMVMREWLRLQPAVAAHVTPAR